ncbi:hypothetical protein [Actinoplanes regularis]|uniref:Uncharacterized protein n=1 Tax=Actinoplanes regularis TaxID=52697 RepID=A0A239AZP7_9ACTN|nr:hypothetical protein [Actinoplanes regularis]GIE87283.1 hypothetical protein Are01nite_37630 [Actinoplanes regularis]SNS00494.1 hypothetical protein SAMN06264365_108199 [Actinoplanes regularis]
MSPRKRTQLLAAASAAAAASALAFAAPAQADTASTEAVIVCDANETAMVFSGRSTTPTITHVLAVTVPAGGSASRTYSTRKVTTITASITVTATTTATVKAAVMGEMSEEFGVTLAAAGERTKETSESVTVTVPGGDYAFYHGEKKYNASWAAHKCNSNGTATSNAGKGTAVSWAVPGEGAASCSASYSTNSFAYYAKRIGC